MKLSVSTDVFCKVPLIPALREIRRIGFENVEINAIPTFKPHIWCDRVWEEELNQLKEVLRELELSVSGIQAAAPLEQGTEGLAYVKGAADLACQLGAPFILLVPRRVEGIITWERALAIRDTFVKNLTEAASYAAQQGVAIAMEVHPNVFIESTANLIPVFREIGGAALRYNLCIPHVLVAGEDLDRAIQLAANYIGYVHVADVKDRAHRHLIPGEGDVDFGSLLSQLQDLGYDGFLSLDIYTYMDDPVPAVRQAFSRMNKIFEQHSRAITKRGG